MPAGTMNDLIGFKGHYRLAQSAAGCARRLLSRSMLFSGGYAGLQLVEGGIANLCLVVTRQALRRGRQELGRACSTASPMNALTWARAWEARSRSSSALSRSSRSLTAISMPRMPESRRACSASATRLRVIPSFTGDGMSIALHSGRLAATTFLAQGQAGANFHRQLRADVQRSLRLSSVLNAAVRHRVGRQAVFHLCRAWPAAMRHVTSLTRVQETSMTRSTGGPMIVPRQIQTSADVAEHYDELDPFYREIWGEHVHHGLWTKGDETPDQAVEALIAHLADRLALEPGQHICDVGCGYGATAEWLATHHGVHVTGITLSSAQLRQAEKREAGAPLLRFMRQDWLDEQIRGQRLRPHRRHRKLRAYAGQAAFLRRGLSHASPRRAARHLCLARPRPRAPLGGTSSARADLPRRPPAGHGQRGGLSHTGRREPASWSTDSRI